MKICVAGRSVDRVDQSIWTLSNAKHFKIIQKQRKRGRAEKNIEKSKLNYAPYTAESVTSEKLQ